jgi:hypothetical protein
MNKYSKIQRKVHLSDHTEYKFMKTSIYRLVWLEGVEINVFSEDERSSE